MGHTSHKMKEGMSHYRSKVKLKVIAPDKKAEKKDAFPMMGSFDAEFDMEIEGHFPN